LNERTEEQKDFNDLEKLFQSLVNGSVPKLVKRLNGSEVFPLLQREDKDLGRRHFGFVRMAGRIVDHLFGESDQ